MKAGIFRRSHGNGRQAARDAAKTILGIEPGVITFSPI
jgi:hypothetical protein